MAKYLFEKGHIMSDEIRHKISISLKNHTVSEETRRKIGIATKKRMNEKPLRYWLGKKRPDMTGGNHPFYGKERVDMRGKNHPMWKGGVSSENKIERHKFRETMQKLIFERDGYKCQICESKGDLQIDHIQSWSEFKELRFDPDNCRTLCSKCHYKITFKREMPKTIKAWGHNLSHITERMVS